MLTRLCNELMRRLSKTQNTVLCGRVLLLLAHLFPLAEKSALNLLGAVNKSNVTSFASTEEAAAILSAEEVEGGSGAGVDASFYRTFWNLCAFLQNPQSVISLPADKWSTFSGALETVLAALEAQPLREGDGGGASGQVLFF